MTPETLLIVADSEHDANMLYAVRMFVPDPFIYLRIHGKCYIVMSDLEIDRAREQAPHCNVISLTQCRKQLEKLRRKANFPQMIRLLLERERIRSVTVPYNFPCGLAYELRRLGIRVVARPGSFFPQRERKNAEEVKKISAALTMAEVGLAEGMQALRTAKIGRKGRLMYKNNPLTSEKLRGIINSAIAQAGGTATNTIVAGGRQGCDPHERGHGVLRANEPIIIDVFPRSQKTGYFGDITRTVVKGRASEILRKMYYTVERGQEIAFEVIGNKVTGRKVHETVQKFFQKEGFRTGKVNGHMQGFFHGTGHGLGLEIHEAPRISPISTDTLRNGHVVTVEPGLYYPEIGGVRLEDVAHVTSKGPKNLTRFEKVLEL
jgi:Xaa-Pro aminopeptidase